MNTLDYIIDSCKIYWKGNKFKEEYVKKVEEMSLGDSLIKVFYFNLVVITISVLINILFGSYSEMSVGTIAFAIIFSVLIVPFFVILFGLIFYSIMHVIFLVWGAKNSLNQTIKFSFSLTFFMSITSLVVTPIYLILFLLGEDSFMFLSIAVILMLFLGFIFMIWYLIIGAQIFSKVHKFSFWKALFAILTPIILLILFFSFLIIGLLI